MINLKHHTILGLKIAALTRGDALDVILRHIAQRKGLRVAFANANLLNFARRDERVQEALSDALVLADGVGIDLVSWIAVGRPLPENLNGTDFTPALLDALPSGTRVLLYGATREVVTKTADVLARRYPIVISGFFDGFSSSAREVVDAAQASSAELILVALGNPKQELWAASASPHLPGAVIIGVGAFFDFVTQSIPRAPLWMRRARAEWLYRLYLEPRRMWRRYILNTPSLLAAVTVEALRARVVKSKSSR